MSSPPRSDVIKTEEEEMEDEERYPRENGEGASEDGTEEGFEEEDDEEEEEERDGDEEEDALNEPQDLSLADYSQYDGAAPPPDANAAANANAAPTTGKLNCDICGLSCVSINVLLVHKRSHTGKAREHTRDLKHTHTHTHTTLRNPLSGDGAARRRGRDVR